MPARKTARKNGDNHTNLEAAVADLIQSQALLNQNQILFNQQLAQTQLQIAQTQMQIAQTNAEIRSLRKEGEERFARIEQLLVNHELILRELPEAIRQKIGFQK